MKNILVFWILSITLFNLACDGANRGANNLLPKSESSEMLVIDQDPHSYAQPNKVRVTHLDWKAEVDFLKTRIIASATLSLDRQDPKADLILDSKDLEINEVKLIDDAGKEIEGTYSESKADPFKGVAISIPLEENTSKVKIDYRTSKKAEALQWLEPTQTADRTHPYLFTQSQAILARSWIPIQDGPGIRFTYNAEVKVQKGMLALMSAQNPQEKNEDGVYTFSMKQPIPAYLMALAAGNIEFAAIGDRTGVYAEPSLIKKSAYEFGEMEQMLEVAEGLYGPYKWDRYDLIVLPPSFPFGGMENPRLTFATPTILAGDRSLTSLVAHELAHSWSGNLVTNATWNDFWLNEGFTVYFERRIMEALKGRDYSEMLALLGYQDLQRTLGELKDKPIDTQLKLELEGRNPDDGMTDIAYEKGYAFLRFMEESFGRESFDKFLRTYFESKAFQVMNTEAFFDYLVENLAGGDDKKVGDLKIKAWLFEPGLPDNCPVPSSDKFSKVDEQVGAFVGGAGAKTLETEGWSSHEWLHFVRNLPKGLTGAQMTELDNAFKFTRSGNSEVLAAWFQHTIANRYIMADQALDSFLIHVGRRKFLTPIYRSLKESGQILRARDVYGRARPNYHSVSTGTIDELLGVND